MTNTLSLRRHFGLPVDPWTGHRVATDDAASVAELVKAAASTQAMVAIIGRSGTGKTSAIDQALTSIRARVVEAYRCDRQRLHMGDIMVALVRDLSDERESPRRSGEARASQVRRLVSNAGLPVVLVIDDMHELHASTLRGLKHLREMGWRGRKPRLGIVLVGEADRTANIPSVDRRTVKVSFSGPSPAEARAALEAACGEVLDGGAVELLATSTAAENWFDLHDLVDRALLEAAIRGEASVSAAAAAAAVDQVAGNQAAEPMAAAAVEPDANTTTTLARLRTA